MPANILVVGDVPCNERQTEPRAREPPGHIQLYGTTRDVRAWSWTGVGDSGGAHGRAGCAGRCSVQMSGARVS